MHLFYEPPDLLFVSMVIGEEPWKNHFYFFKLLLMDIQRDGDLQLIYCTPNDTLIGFGILRTLSSRKCHWIWSIDMLENIIMSSCFLY